MMDHLTLNTPSSKHRDISSQPNTFTSAHTQGRPAASMFHHPNLSLNPTQHYNHHEGDEFDEQTPDERRTVYEEDGGHKEEEEKEHMFEKPLTPSDVGKLNRLVIPKQHAEKYFPLSFDSGEKGLLLSFEDESGKSWRFRYSYWNSSQSYVLTKGWSRFVKDKRLDAGDVVWFERRRPAGDRFFIRWRRRVAPVQDSGAAHDTAATSGSRSRVFYSAHPYPSHPHYQPHSLHSEFKAVEQSQIQTPAVNSKRLRLFGVNLDCQMDESELPVPDGSSEGRVQQLFGFPR